MLKNIWTPGLLVLAMAGAPAAAQTAVDQCVASQRPKVAARMGCRQRGRKQGLAGTKLKEFINTCASLPQT